MGICESSCRNIILKYKKTQKLSLGKIGGSKGKLSDEAKEAILNILEEDQFVSLDKLVTFLNAFDGTKCCGVTIGNFLHRQFVSFKEGPVSEEDKNCVRVKTSRMEFVGRFLDGEWRRSEQVYICESTFNLWHHDRRRHQSPNCRDPNIGLVVAIGHRGPVHFRARTGSFDKEGYAEFVAELEAKLGASQKYYLIHDSDSVHQDVSTRHAVHVVTHLPPCSPFLNPMESVFSRLKAHVRKEMSARPEILIGETAARVEKMTEIIAAEICKPDYLYLAPFFRHVKTFFSRCMTMADISGD